MAQRSRGSDRVSLGKLLYVGRSHEHVAELRGRARERRIPGTINAVVVRNQDPQFRPDHIPWAEGVLAERIHAAGG